MIIHVEAFGGVSGTGMGLEDGSENVYRCSSTSPCLVVKFDAVGVKLLGDRMTGCDGARVKLHEAQ